MPQLFLAVKNARKKAQISYFFGRTKNIFSVE